MVPALIYKNHLEAIRIVHPSSTSSTLTTSPPDTFPNSSAASPTQLHNPRQHKSENFPSIKSKETLTSIKQVVARHKQDRQRNNRRHPLPRRHIVPLLKLLLRLCLLGLFRQPVLLLREPPHARRPERRIPRLGRSQGSCFRCVCRRRRRRRYPWRRGRSGRRLIHRPRSIHRNLARWRRRISSFRQRRRCKAQNRAIGRPPAKALANLPLVAL